MDTINLYGVKVQASDYCALKALTALLAKYTYAKKARVVYLATRTLAEARRMDHE